MCNKSKRIEIATNTNPHNYMPHLIQHISALVALLATVIAFLFTTSCSFQIFQNTNPSHCQHHLTPYQIRDAQYITYDGWLLPGKSPRYLRGTQVKSDDLASGRYFSVIGAAESYGPYAAQPYPTLLSAKLNLPVLNFGSGGAGPAYFNSTNNNDIIEWANRGRFVIVTFMSARQSSNSQFASSAGTLHGYTLDGNTVHSTQFWSAVVSKYWDNNKSVISNLVEESRNDYIREYRILLSKFKVPIILFYFSKRNPAYDIDWKNKDIGHLFRSFPQLVNNSTINHILSDTPVPFVSCVSKQGIPQILQPRASTTNMSIVSVTNRYYPSPQMHIEAADKLFPICLTFN